jgi:hypothetical protein
MTTVHSKLRASALAHGNHARPLPFDNRTTRSWFPIAEAFFTLRGCVATVRVSATG